MSVEDMPAVRRPATNVMHPNSWIDVAEGVLNLSIVSSTSGQGPSSLSAAFNSPSCRSIKTKYGFINCVKAHHEANESRGIGVDVDVRGVHDATAVEVKKA